MICDFTYRHYKETLEYAKKAGYIFYRYRDFREAFDKPKTIFMRHDLDFGLKNACIFAQMEHNLGICCTYFIRVHARYNPFSYKNYKHIEKIRQLGHELGLHWSPDFADVCNEDREAIFLRDKKCIEAIIGTRIYGISIHEPARVGISLDESRLKDLGLDYNAYSPIFTEQIKYISESAGRWREACMCDFIKKEVPKLSILTHPVWWYEKTPLENY